MLGRHPRHLLSSPNESARLRCGRLDSRGEQRHGDMVWRLHVGGEWIYIYILLEFQSFSDPWMALRMQVYVGLLCQDLVRQHRLTSGGKLPPVLPIVLYSGEGRWTAKVRLSELMLAPPEGLASLQPEQKYLLIDQGKYKSGTSAQSNLVRALFKLERAASVDDALSIVEAFQAWLKQNQSLMADLDRWTRGMRRRRPKVQEEMMEPVEMSDALAKDYADLCVEILKKKIEREAMTAGMQKGRKEGRKEGRRMGEKIGRLEGRQEGLIEARREVLLRLIHKRLGLLPGEASTQIDAATAQQLDDWIDRLIDGAHPAQLFNAK